MCEKSDGIRVLLFISTLGDTQNVFLVRVQLIPFIQSVVPNPPLFSHRVSALNRALAGQAQQLPPARRTLLPSPRRPSHSSQEFPGRWGIGSGRRSANEEGKGSFILPPRTYVDPQGSFRQETLRYLCFDCLVIDDQNVMDRTLDKRYGVCRRIQPIRTAPSLNLPSL